MASSASAVGDSTDVVRAVGDRLVRVLERVEARLVERRQFRWSEHLLFEVRGNGNGAERVLVKRVKAHDRRGRIQNPAIDPRARSLAEHAALDTIHRIFARTAIDGLIAVRPCGCFPELDAVAMDYRPGRHLLSMIARAARPLTGNRAHARAAEAAYRAGQWLALVHRALAADPPPEAIPAARYAARFGEEMKALAAALPEPAGTLLSDADAALRASVRAAETVRILPLHGDFYPDNVVVSSGGLYAVDTTLLARGPAELDLARFVVGVGTLKLHVIAGEAWVRSRPIERFQRAFLDGYRTLALVDASLLHPAIARATLMRWSELRSVAGIDLPAPVLALVRRRIDRFMAARLERALAALAPDRASPAPMAVGNVA